MLIPVLFVANVASERRLWRHLALAALASSGFVGWTALGWLHGSGGTSYYDLMQGMGFRPATGLLRAELQGAVPRLVPGEPGEGLCDLPARGDRRSARGGRPRRRARVPPRGAGAAGLLRRLRRMIVIFGINKARYVYPTEWIPLFFFALGALRERAGRGARPGAGPRRGGRVARRRPAGARRSSSRAATRSASSRRRGAQPGGLDVGFAAFALALLAALARRPPRCGARAPRSRRRPGAPRRAHAAGRRRHPREAQGALQGLLLELAAPTWRPTGWSASLGAGGARRRGEPRATSST